jgi:hypothetical protein
MSTQKAVLTLGIIWTFAAFGEELGYRGYLLTRAADLGNRSKVAYVISMLGVPVLFGFGHYYKGPSGVRQHVLGADARNPLSVVGPKPLGHHPCSWIERYLRGRARVHGLGELERGIMTSKTPAWALIGKVIAVCVAGGGVALLYRLGLADIGGVLVLSAIIVSAITFARSGALSAAWLQHRDRNRVIQLGHLELAKAFACGGLGIDLVRGLGFGLSHRIVPMTPVTWTIILSVAVVSAMGAGLFLVRWFAAYLTLRRRRS